jgi:hypothetical protein
MIDVSILYILKDFFTLSFPTDITTTIQSAEGNRIVLNVSAGVTDAWMGGVVQINDTTSDYDRMFAVIIGNTGNTLTLASPMIGRGDLSVLVGKTVTVSGGPLSKSRVFITDPTNVEKAFTANKDYLIVLNISGGGLKQRSIGAAIGKGAHSTQSETDIEVACETKDINSNSTPAEVFNAAFGIHILKHQVLFLTHMYVAKAIRPISAPEYNYQLLSYTRPGTDIRLRACVIEFTLNIV